MFGTFLLLTSWIAVEENNLHRYNQNRITTVNALMYVSPLNSTTHQSSDFHARFFGCHRVEWLTAVFRDDAKELLSPMPAQKLIVNGS